MATKQTRRQRAAQPKATAKPAEPIVENAARVSPTINSLSSALSLFTRSVKMLTTHWKFWALYCLLFGFLNLLFVHNFSTDVGSIKDNLEGFLGAQSVATGFSAYALLIANNSTAPGATAAYQYVLLIIASLAAIWALRQFMSDKATDEIKVRDSLYRGMYPIIPFVLVLLVLFVELIPLIITGSIYSMAVSSGVARTVLEQLIFLAIFFAGAAVSGWLIVRSVFALYIVTLADMRPVQALRDSARIVKGRHLGIIRRLLVMLLMLLLGSIIVLVPIILFATPLAQFTFFILSIIAIPFMHSYMYSLYRELLG